MRGSEMSAVSILIVEDEAITAMYMEKIFIRRGYDVIGCVSSGEDAIASSISLKPDLVVLDVRLAGSLDGIDTAAKIKEMTDGRVQLVFVTGYSDTDLMDRAMKINPLHYFLKPLNLSEFTRVVESFFSNKQGNYR
jgi:two-component SAPR family response regulator